jgi:hypothetical protein
MWTQATLENLIRDQVQEGPNLEYKAADALSRADGKIKEITKDVSAFANASGGVLIYGVKEFDEEVKRHLPEKLDPIDQTLFSREWLEQIINNIKPKISEITIHPVNLTTAINHAVYVVEIPQSTTAHQANDYRYYKRFNFVATPMEDYEIRDVMNRQTVPNVSIAFSLYLGGIDGESVQGGREYRGLKVDIKNETDRVINRIKVELQLTNAGWHEDGNFYEEMVEHYFEKDESMLFSEVGLEDGSIELGFVYQPGGILFPGEEFNIGRKIQWGYPSFDNREWNKLAQEKNWQINWRLYADNMPRKQGVINLWELPFKA